MNREVLASVTVKIYTLRMFRAYSLFSAALLAAESSISALDVGFGAVFKGTNPDGAQNWKTSVTQLSPHESSDYVVLEL